VTVGNSQVSFLSLRRKILTPRQVRVKSMFCGICGSDQHSYHQEPKKIVLGHEVSGVVSEVGSQVRSLVVGQNVVLVPLVWCGTCDRCKEGKINQCSSILINGLMVDGGLAEEFIAGEEQLISLPPTVDCRLGSLVEPIAVVVQAFKLLGCSFEPNDPVPKSRVLIWGSGSIGLCCIPVASACGYTEIFIVGRYDFQKETAVKLGNLIGIRVHVVDENEAAKIQADAVIETVGGSSSTIQSCCDAVRTGGTVVLLGIFSPKAEGPSPLLTVTKQIKWIGSCCYDKQGEVSDFTRAIGILENHGKAIYSVIVTHSFPMEEVGHGFELLNNKSTSGVIKIVIEI